MTPFIVFLNYFLHCITEVDKVNFRNGEINNLSVLSRKQKMILSDVKIMYDIAMNTKDKAYIRIYEQLKDRILHEDYLYGTKLPSKRELSRQFGVSLPTIEHALLMLMEEGYIRSEERSGNFVIYRREEMFGREGLKASLRETIVTEESSFPYSVFARTAREVLSIYEESVLGKGDGKGCHTLRQAIAAYLGRYRGMHVEADRIVIGAGSEYLYSLVVSLLGRTRVYGIEDPSYEAIGKTYRYQDVVIDRLPLGTHGIESRVLQKTKASILHVTPYRSYPSNTSTDHRKRKEYISWANETDRWIVEDDYESEFTPAILGSETLYEMDPDHVIYMNTFSRTVSPSIRLSYMVLPPRLNEKYNETQIFRACTVSLYLQLIMAQLLNNGSFERHLNKVRQNSRNENV